MKQILFAVVFSFALPVLAEDFPANGQTDVYYTSTATAVRSRRKEHPWKINCIGHDTEFVSDANVKAAWTSSDKSVSQKELSVDGVHDDIRRQVYETLNYNFEYAGDDVLHLSFSSTGQRTQQNEWSTDCTYTKTQSSVTNASQELKGRAYLVVPPNVYAIRITNTKSTLKNLESETHAQIAYYPHFAENLKSQKSIRQIVMGDRSLPFVPGAAIYQLVRPGDVLEVDLDIQTTELTDQSADLEWDLNFLGTKQCGQMLAPPSKEFSATQVLNLLTQPVVTNQSFDDFVTRTSCLRDKNYVHELMVNSSGKSFAGLIESYQQWLTNQNFLSPGVDRASFASLAASIAELTLFDLSENLLQDMTQYCRVDALPVLIGLPPAFRALIRGYHSAARTYLKVDYLWQIGRNPNVDLFLQKMKEHEKAKVTYAQADADPDFLNYAKAIQYKLFTDDIRVYDSMQSILKDIPTTVTGSRAHQELNELIARANVLADDISGGLRDAIVAYGRRHTDLVQAKTLRSQWAQLLVVRRSIALLIRDDLDWFKFEDNDPLKTRFTEDMSMISRDIYRANADILTDSDPSPAAQLRREIFMKSGDTDSAGRVDVAHVNVLSSQINQCLSSPTNEVQK